jgi:peroxiredoxin
MEGRMGRSRRRQAGSRNGTQGGAQSAAGARPGAARHEKEQPEAAVTEGASVRETTGRGGAARRGSARAGKTQARSGRGRKGRGIGRWGYAALGAVVLLLAFRAWGGAGAMTVARVGAEVPPLEVKTLDGQKIALRDLRGKVVLVNFWATWCPPCRAEMPGFESVWRERQKDGFVVLGLSADEGGSGGVAMFLGDRGITYPVGMASATAKRQFGGINALPASFLVDKRGIVRRQVTGMFDERLLRQDVNRLLAEPGPVTGS